MFIQFYLPNGSSRLQLRVLAAGSKFFHGIPQAYLSNGIQINCTVAARCTEQFIPGTQNGRNSYSD